MSDIKDSALTVAGTLTTTDIVAVTQTMGGTPTGPFKITLLLLKAFFAKLRDPLVALTSTGGALAVDCALGSYFTHTMTENTTLSISNAPGSGLAQTITMRFKQHASAAKTLTLPASFKPIVGSDTAINVTLDGYTILTATSFDQGTRWEYSMKAGS